jgi:hypothetical protein
MICLSTSEFSIPFLCLSSSNYMPGPFIYFMVIPGDDCDSARSSLSISPRCLVYFYFLNSENVTKFQPPSINQVQLSHNLNVLRIL